MLAESFENSVLGTGLATKTFSHTSRKPSGKITTGFDIEPSGKREGETENTWGRDIETGITQSKEINTHNRRLKEEERASHTSLIY